MIIAESANTFWEVREAADPALAHCWIGHRVKRTKIGFVRTACPQGKRDVLVRKEATRIVEAA